MGEKKFYICKHCGNMIGMIKSSGVNVVCCGDPMTELKPNTVEASQEKHLPVVTVEGNSVKVKVGSVEHPMTEEHHIAWIYLETEQGGQRKKLAVGSKPEAEFALAGGDKVVGVYEYCNLHGLWLTKVE
ncbi:desulfoferrodoxin family protein [Phascolarctobacterium faecium]|jgi:rubredoxin oxidoreductase (desulfoferrodoxin)|uniref:desulfoferrodoxin family protein n=2 Tax=Phascolarctobacterium faecium TaxID=33025 RepID=UPI0026663DC9|nr:desulfoferrodoxin family protein [Phascolarctobacterium faecium]